MFWFIKSFLSNSCVLYDTTNMFPDNDEQAIVFYYPNVNTIARVIYAYKWSLHCTTKNLQNILLTFSWTCNSLKVDYESRLFGVSSVKMVWNAAAGGHIPDVYEPEYNNTLMFLKKYGLQHDRLGRCAMERYRRWGVVKTPTLIYKSLSS